MDAPETDDHGTDPLLAGLTPSQRAAVLATQGPLLVLAGPGSGKTRVITRRIAHLLRGGVPPWNILAVTFTNKAAGEMRDRIGRLLGGGEASPPPRGLTISTFHSLCVRLLRRYADVGGLAEKGLLRGDFTVVDADDQGKIAKRVLAELNFASQNFPPRSVLEQVSAAKNQLVSAEEYKERAGDFFTRCIARAYEGYQRELRRSNSCDFDDLLMLTALLLRDNPQVRAECQRRYRWIMIDEYQDTNRAQLEIATQLAGEPGDRPSICVVGDPDQSIYAWRGADITNILTFEQRYPGATVIRLEENFRSRQRVLAAASRLIARNGQRKHKDLIATRPGGENVELVLCRDEKHEAGLVVDWFRGLRQSGVVDEHGARRSIDWKDCAVFYRTNALSRVLEDAFRAEGIPYALVRGTAFYQREEVRDAVAYLRVVANFDDAVSHERIINKPARGISDKTWAALEEAAAGRGVGVPGVLRSPQEAAGLTARAVGAIQRYVEQIDRWAAPAGDSFMGATDVEPSLRDLVGSVVRESGLEAFYAKDDEKRANLDELVSSAADFEQRLIDGEFAIDDEPGAEGDDEPRVYPLGEKLRAFLERVALVADTDGLNAASGAVTLMTLHAAKGLEFPAVAMVGLEEGILPHVRGLESAEAREEERRLCFVGVTRAMDRLLITAASFRTVRGLQERQIPSSFLEELKGEGVTVSDRGYGGGVGLMERDGEAGADAALQFSSARAPAMAGERRIDRSEFEPAPKARSPYPVGSIVRHPQFGLGEVKGFMAGANARIKVNFKTGGEKTLVLEFARLERVR